MADTDAKARHITQHMNADYESFHSKPTSTNIALYFVFNGTRVAIRRDADVYWLHGDHLGSASLTTNITGAVVCEMRYYPFGESRWVSGTLPTDKRVILAGLADLRGLWFAPGYSCRHPQPTGTGAQPKQPSCSIMGA